MRLSFVTFVFLAVNLTAYAAPVRELDTPHAVSGTPAFNVRDKLAARKPPAKPPVAKPTPAKPPPPAKATAKPPPAKPAPSAKAAPPAKASAKGTPSAKAAPPEKSASSKGVPPAKTVRPAKSASSTSTSAAATSTGEPGEVCELRPGKGDVPAKGGKGRAPKKGVISRRGNCFSSPALDDGTAAADDTLPPSKAAAKGLGPSQIALTREATGAIETGTISPLVPGAKDPGGAAGTVFRVNWPNAANQVAKRFRIDADFTEESRNLRTLNRLTASGKSTTGPTGPVAPWIVTNLVPGRSLTAFPQFRAILAGPRQECLRFLRRRCDLLSQAAVAFESSGLFHKDLNDGNIHWTVLDDRTPPQFLDFGNMATNEAEKNQALQGESDDEEVRGHGPGTVTDTDTFARARCRVNWPERRCVGPDDAADPATDDA